MFEVRADRKDGGGILGDITGWALRAGGGADGDGVQRAGVATPVVVSDLPCLAHHTSQTCSYFLPESLKGPLETFAEQSIQKRIDVRVQQHQPVGKGNSRGRDKAGLAGNCRFRGLNEGHTHVRCPAEEEGWDDQEETHHSVLVVVLLGVLSGRLGGAGSQDGAQTSG